MTGRRARGARRRSGRIGCYRMELDVLLQRDRAHARSRTGAVLPSFVTRLAQVAVLVNRAVNRAVLARSVPMAPVDVDARRPCFAVSGFGVHYALVEAASAVKKGAVAHFVASFAAQNVAELLR